MKTLFRSLLVLAFTATACLASPAAAPTASREYIMLSGGPSIMVWEKWKSQPKQTTSANMTRCMMRAARKALLMPMA